MAAPVPPLLVWSDLKSPTGERIRGFDWFFSPLSLRDWLENWLLPAAVEALLETGHATRSPARLVELAQGHPWLASAQAACAAVWALREVPLLDLKAACLALPGELEPIFAPTPAPLHLRLFPDLLSAGQIIWAQHLCSQADLGDFGDWLALCEAAQTESEALLELRLRLA